MSLDLDQEPPKQLADENIWMVGFGLPHPRSCFFEQPQFEGLLGDDFLQVLRLPLELLDLIGHSRPCGIPGKPALAASRNSRLLRALRREHPHADFVFLSERKAPLSVDGAQKLIERLAEAAKLPLPIHALPALRRVRYSIKIGRKLDVVLLHFFERCPSKPSQIVMSDELIER